MCLVSHVCRAVPHCPLESTTQPLMPHSLVSPVTYQLAELGTWGPELERSCQTSKAGYFLPVKTLCSAVPTGPGALCPGACGVSPGTQTVPACCLWDRNLPAESLDFLHQLISHKAQAISPGNTDLLSFHLVSNHWSALETLSRFYFLWKHHQFKF